MTDRADWAVREVEYEKSHTEDLTAVFERVQAAGTSFEDQAEHEFREQLFAKMGLFFLPTRMTALLDRLDREAFDEFHQGQPYREGSAFKRLQHQLHQVDFCRHLVDRFPEAVARRQELYDGCYLRGMPALRYPALLMAGLATSRSRKSKPGDRYDIAHLTKGLSRCDVVTADSGMVQLCRDLRLVPTGVALFGPRELDKMREHLELLCPE